MTCSDCKGKGYIELFMTSQSCDCQQTREEAKCIIDKWGTKEWSLNGEYHREDGPAIEYINGTKMWYINGKRHREDGPAMELSDGSKFWYINDQRHREDGPAVEFANGTKYGPAKEYSTGIKYWYLNGEQLTEKEFNNFTIDRPETAIHHLDGDVSNNNSENIVVISMTGINPK